MSRHVQECRCCKMQISGEIYHLGFSDMEAVYCERCPNVLLIKDHQFYSRNGIEIPFLVAGEKGWLEYDAHLLPFFEQAEQYLPPCSCGGHFRYMATPRCPSCSGYIMGKDYEGKPVLRNARYVFVTKESFSL